MSFSRTVEISSSITRSSTNSRHFSSTRHLRIPICQVLRVRYPTLYEMRFNAAKVRPCKKYEIIFLNPQGFIPLEGTRARACVCVCRYTLFAILGNSTLINDSIDSPSSVHEYFSSTFTYTPYSFSFFVSTRFDTLDRYSICADRCYFLSCSFEIVQRAGVHRKKHKRGRLSCRELGTE